MIVAVEEGYRQAVAFYLSVREIHGLDASPYTTF